jgi:hypothetical protein
LFDVVELSKEPSSLRAGSCLVRHAIRLIETNKSTERSFAIASLCRATFTASGRRNACGGIWGALAESNCSEPTFARAHQRS